MTNPISVIPAVNTMSLDELYEIASTYGRVDLGGMMGAECAEINCSFTGSDYVALRSREYSTLKQNLAAVIDKAASLKMMYQR